MNLDQANRNVVGAPAQELLRGGEGSHGLAEEDGSYYERLGGDNKMAMFVEDFMEGIMGDPELACHHK